MAFYLYATTDDPQRPYIWRCYDCGLKTNPTGKTRVWHRCRRIDLTTTRSCACRGLGDLVAYALHWIARRVPQKCGELRKLLMQRPSRYTPVVTWLFGSPAEHKGCGCSERQQSLNARYPARRLCRRLCPPPEPLVGNSPKLALWTFPHGLGDAVQFTAVLRHVRAIHPELTVDVRCKVGAHTAFRGLARRTFVYNGPPDGEQPILGDYADIRQVSFAEPEETFADSPATKVERCLKEMLGVRPTPELNYYSVQTYDHERAEAERWLEEICGARREERRLEAGGRRAQDGHFPPASSLPPPASRLPPPAFPVVLIHYQGNSARAWKNIEEEIARDVIHAVLESSYVPVVLDFETPYRSKWAGKIDGLEMLGAAHPMFGGTGTGDAAQLAAVIERVALIVGIDSGPEHIAAATDTPTIVVWKQLHPVNYFGLADNVTHVVRPDQQRFIRGDVATGDRYFRDHYHYHFCHQHLRYVLPRLVAERLTASRRGAEVAG